MFIPFTGLSPVRGGWLCACFICDRVVYIIVHVISVIVDVTVMSGSVIVDVFDLQVGVVRETGRCCRNFEFF